MNYEGWAVYVEGVGTAHFEFEHNALNLFNRVEVHAILYKVEKNGNMIILKEKVK